MTAFTRTMIVVALFLAASQLPAQEAFQGFTLFNPTNSRTTYLVDMAGEIVHTWSNSAGGGYAVYLKENGNLLRPARADGTSLNGGAAAGLVQEIDWGGNVLWEFEYNSPTYLSHHDLEIMPNGNVLLIAWEVKSAAEAQAAGRESNSVFWPDHVIEVEPDGDGGAKIVWQWHAWDHLVQDRDPTKPNYGIIAEHPELIDINLRLTGSNPRGGGDWLHINGVSYNPELDQIVISSHYMNEFYVIDHSTTTEEAAGHSGGRYGKGGDILYRWGSPENYDAEGETVFDVIHCSNWIPQGLPGAGNILVFNNGEGQRRSVITEITPVSDGAGNYLLTAGRAFGPLEPTWTYSEGTGFYSNHLGSCQRLPNGNTLISESTSGYLFEVTADGQKVWDFQFQGQIARSLRYAADYPGLARLNPTAVDAADTPAASLALRTSPNPFSSETTISFRLSGPTAVDARIYDELGRELIILDRGRREPGLHHLEWDGSTAAGHPVKAGIYHCRLRAGDQVQSIALLIVK